MTSTKRCGAARSPAAMRLIGAGLLAGIGLAVVSSAVKRTRYRFTNKCVVITGGSRGLGLALARQLACEGAKLALLARSPKDLRGAEDQLVHETRGRAQIITIPCDVRDQADVEAAIALVIERFGKIDVLINNAGVIQVGPIDNMGVNEFDDAMATHLYGPLFTMLEVIPHMRQQGGGRIVNVSSIGGKVAVPHLAPYCASKFALVGLSDTMRAELARDNILVTTVCPWLMRTGSVYNVEVKGKHDREFAWFAAGASVPLLTVNADRAARKIIEACRRGAARQIMSPYGKLSAFVDEIAPGMMAALQRFANRILPRPDLNEGDFVRTGWQSRSRLTPKPLMRITNRAALRNNEIRHAIREARSAGQRELVEAVGGEV